MALDKIQDPKKMRYVEGHMEADYIYTAGIAGDRFLETIRDKGVLLATHCDKCNVTYLPPRIYCARCFAQLKIWKEVPSTGIIQTFTMVSEDANGKPLAQPKMLAFIQIDNTNGGLIHTIGEAKPEQLKIGMRVKAVFKKPAERTGALTDIQYFKPGTA
jgi:uncharacterized OB-fold protein